MTRVASETTHLDPSSSQASVRRGESDPESRISRVRDRTMLFWNDMVSGFQQHWDKGLKVVLFLTVCVGLSFALFFIARATHTTKDDTDSSGDFESSGQDLSKNPSYTALAYIIPSVIICGFFVMVADKLPPSDVNWIPA